MQQQLRMSSTNGADGGLTPSSRNYTRTNDLQRDMAWDTELTNYIVTGSWEQPKLSL